MMTRATAGALLNAFRGMHTNPIVLPSAMSVPVNDVPETSAAKARVDSQAVSSSAFV